MGTPSDIDWLDTTVELMPCGDGCWTAQANHWVYGLWAEVQGTKAVETSGRFDGNGEMAGPGWPVEFRWVGDGTPPLTREVGLQHLADQ